MGRCQLRGNWPRLQPMPPQRPWPGARGALPRPPPRQSLPPKSKKLRILQSRNRSCRQPTRRQMRSSAQIRSPSKPPRCSLTARFPPRRRTPPLRGPQPQQRDLPGVHRWSAKPGLQLQAPQPGAIEARASTTDPCDDDGPERQDQKADGCNRKHEPGRVSPIAGSPILARHGHRPIDPEGPGRPS